MADMDWKPKLKFKGRTAAFNRPCYKFEITNLPVPTYKFVFVSDFWQNAA